MSERAARRGKNLDDADIATIVGILDGWHGPLSWESLISEVEMRLFSRYTRQALHRHARIRAAFLARKAGAERPKTSSAKSASPAIVALSQKIERVEEENRRLVRENGALLEQFARWAYNSYASGLSREVLDRPLPLISRGQTRKPKSK